MATRPRFIPERSGVSAVELAVTLPVVVVLLFGMIELGRILSIHHTFEEAARAGCRIYSANGTTETEIRNMVDDVLEDSGISGYTVTLDPINAAAVEYSMTPVTVEVSVDYEDITWFGNLWVMHGKTLSASCTMPFDADIDEEEDPQDPSAPPGDEDGDENEDDVVDDDDDDDHRPRGRRRRGRGYGRRR